MVTKCELGEWVSVHEAGFPGFKQWWLTGDSQEVIQIRSRLWLGRLQRFSVNQMVSATEAMFSARDKPQFFSDHLDWICNRLNPRPQHNASIGYGQRCEACHGTGIVSVIFFEPRLTVGGNPLPGNRGPAACRCPIGRHLNERRQAHSECQRLPEWNDDEMTIEVMERPTPEEVAECRERLARTNPAWLAVVEKICQRRPRRLGAA